MLSTIRILPFTSLIVRAHMQAAAFPIADYNFLEVQNTLRAMREC